MPNDARSRPSSTVRGRALLAFGALAAVAGVVLTLAAFGGDDTDPDHVVLDVDDAVATAVPVTVPPLAAGSAEPPPTAAPAPPGTTDEPAPSTATVPPTSADTPSPTPTPDPSAPSPDPSAPTTSLSPLAELLGRRGSAIPPEIEPRVRPEGLLIEGIDLWGPVRPVGLDDDGELEVPDETEIGWYRYGSAPGRPGATVLAAHVTWNSTYGPFFRLGELDPGDRVEVQLEDGSVRVYEVIERTMYDKDGLPRERIWRNTGDETLVLITCGGDFNPDISRYRQNIVVYAVPVA